MNTVNNGFPGTNRTLSLIITALLASPMALAADEGWYVGAAIGQTRSSLDFNSANLSGLPPGVTLHNSRDDDLDVGFKLFGGYQFNTYFALEGGRFDLGDFDFSAQTNPTGTSEGNFNINGLYFDVVGTIPLTQKLDLLGRAGLNHADTVTRLRGTGAVPSTRPKNRGSDSNLKLGLGLQYALADNLDLRLEVERYHLDEPFVDKDNVDLISLGLVYRFGQRPVARKAVSPAPVTPVARVAPPAATPTPAPAPVTTPAPLSPAPTRVVLSADSLFDFDQSIIKDSGKQELDLLIANLKGTSFDIISVTGHTDRIGNQDYNLRLSQRRADAVKNYLVQIGQLPAAKITSRGVNGENSAIRPNQCTNTAGRAALILCLQPDRRVEVEVTATKQ